MSGQRRVRSAWLSLFIVPTVYTLLDDFREWLSDRLRKRAPEAPKVELSPH